MSFASLEEAWGVPAFGDQRPGPKPQQEPQQAPQQQPRPARPDREFPSAFDHGSDRRTVLPQQQVDDPGSEERVARDVLERAFRTRGAAAVLELLPVECQRQVVARAAAAQAPARRLRRRPRRRRRQRGGSWLRAVTRALSDPNVLLLLLVAAFVAMWSWDTRAEVPNIASLHMSPFPMGR